MDTITTILKHGADKNCMLVLVDSYSYPIGRRLVARAAASRLRDGDGVIVYEAYLVRGFKAYFSVLGKDVELSSGDTVQLNTSYANKLGLKNGEPLLLKRIKSTVARARSVHVEPVSVDDWEVVEHNASRVELVLLDQVRVVWKDQILPIWIERANHVYMRIISTEPAAPCVILEKNTEVVVAPKVRAIVPPSTLPLKHQYKTMNSPSRKTSEQLSNSSEYDNIDILEPRPSITSPNKSPRTSVKKTSLPLRFPMRSSTLPLAQRQSSLMESVMKFIFPNMFLGEKKEVMDNLSDSDKGSFIDFSMKDLPSRNGVLRVQPMTLSCKLEECFSASKLELNKQILSNPMFVFRSHKKKPIIKESLENSNYYNVPLEIFHPSTVYVDAECTKNERCIHPYLPHLPNNFIARLQRLPSPQEKTMAAQKTVKKPKSGNAGAVADPSQADMDGPDGMLSDLGAGDQTSINESCYVRVVVIDRNAGLTDKVWQKAADQVLSNQPLLYGHVIIPDLLRRQLRLETTSSVWIQTGAIDLVIPHKIHIYILSSLPKTIGKDLVIMAFINYIKQCANEEHPLVVFQGIFLKFFIFPETYVEVQLTFFGENDPGNVKAVTMLSELNIDHVQLVIEQDVWEDKLGVVNSLLPYCSTNDFDTLPFPQKLKQLGGVDNLVQQALLCLHASLASRPLSRQTFQVRGGLSHGILLITGPRGSGKSSLVKGLCRKMAHLPVLAHIALVDCKTLRGKTVSTIQKILEMVFDEAAWREPAIVILENLDIIVPAPSGPETEFTGESLYAAKNAQVLEGLIRYEIQNNSRVTVIATSLSSSSLHPSLTSSRGMHCIQQTLNIGNPDKDAREKILLSILQRHTNITLQTVKTLDVASIAVKTESFVARDLELLVNRTLHARMSKDRDEFVSKFTLTFDDFEETLSTFKPVSVRNVPLHKAGDLGWVDVGGLSIVKKVLMETLRWPTKYPQLFSSSPLRLRSGILLYGAPGTGKTLLAGVVAKECGLNFISVKGPELLNKYIGASEQAIRDLFTKAQSAKPCILFFDEFDSIAPKRGHDSTGVTDRVVNQLLTQLDGVEGLQGVYVLAATSRPDLIDPALLRPGRLDLCQYCPIPDENERCEILVALTHKMSLAVNVDLKEVAAECEHFTGADLKALLYNAQLNVIHEKTDGDRSLNESVFWIKGDSNQCGTRRASVVKDETGAIKMSLSKSISGSLGDKSSDLQSPRRVSHSSPQQSSGNSSGSKTSANHHFKFDVDDLSHVDLSNKVSRRDNDDIVTDAVIQYDDQAESGEVDVLNLRNLDSDQVDGEILDYTKRNGDPSFTSAVDYKSLEVIPTSYSETVDDNLPERLSENLQMKHVQGDPSLKYKVIGEALSNMADRYAANLDIAETKQISTDTTVDSFQNIQDVADTLRNIADRAAANLDIAETKQISTDATAASIQNMAVAQEAHIPNQNETQTSSEDADAVTNAALETGDSLQSLKPISTISYRKRRGLDRIQARGNHKYMANNKDEIKPSFDIKSPSVDRPVTVFTSLKSGLATLSAEDEARYISMVKEIQHRDETLFEAASSKRRNSLQLESRMSVLMEVCQHHLMEAVRSMRPSVSSSERERYMKIYNHFVSSRKAGFEKMQVTSVGKRATLA